MTDTTKTTYWEQLRDVSHRANLVDKARILGEADGEAAVQTLLHQHGAAAVASTIQPGQVSWGQAARNVEAHTFNLLLGSEPCYDQIDAYYDGYGKAAREYVEEIARGYHDNVS